jgi:hypothetical protein
MSARIEQPDELFDTPAPSYSPIPDEPESEVRLRAKSMTLGEFAAIPPRKKRLYGDEKARAEMEEYAASGEWDGATGAHLVALYDKLHAAVYGVASDLDRKSRMFASSAATAMVKRDFQNDMSAAVRFMRWVWTREQAREEWRRANKRDGQRIGWRLQFCFGALVADYRVHRARQSEA